MPTTIATIRSRVRQDLHDEDSGAYRWTDAVLDRHITRAANDYSLEAPLEQKSTLTTTAGSRAISVASLTNIIAIDAVEYPVDQYPPKYAPVSRWQGVMTLDLQAAPVGVEDVNVYWTRVHTLDGSTSTIPVAHEEIIAIGAAAHAALDWTSFATNRINTGGEDVWGRYQAFGESRHRDFRRELARIARANRVRSRKLFAPGGPAPESRDHVYGP